MSTDILQRYLAKMLIDVGADDTRLEKLRSAAADVAEALKNDRANALRYAMVAVDPSVSSSDPAWPFVAEIIEKHWNTYKSRFASEPQPLLRSVLLEGFSRAGTEPGIACAISTASRNLLPHISSHPEFALWTDLLVSSETLCYERAAEDWISSRSLAAKMNSASAVVPKIDRTKLAAALLAASGPNNAQNEAIANANPHWPSNNAAWTQEFSNRAAAAIEAVIDAPFVNGTFAEIPSIVAAIERSDIALYLRTNLLWWKEAMYSVAAKTSYRELEPAMNAVLMAIEMHDQVRPFTPPSVDFFLAEAVKNACGSAGSTAQPLTRLISDLFASESKRHLVFAILESHRQTDGRGPAVGFIADILAGGVNDPSRYPQAVGVDASTKFTPSNFSVWIFRELQCLAANRLAAAPKGDNP